MGPFSMYTMHSFINVINPLMLYKITLYTPAKIISTSVNTKHLTQSSEIPLKTMSRNCWWTQWSYRPYFLFYIHPIKNIKIKLGHWDNNTPVYIGQWHPQLSFLCHSRAQHTCTLTEKLDNQLDLLVGLLQRFVQPSAFWITDICPHCRYSHLGI